MIAQALRLKFERHARRHSALIAASDDTELPDMETSVAFDEHLDLLLDEALKPAKSED